VIFRFKHESIFLFWDRAGLPNNVDKHSKPSGNQVFDKTLKLYGINFYISSSNNSSVNTLVIKPSGLKINNSDINKEIDGTVTGAEIADLNSDGSPEIYVYINSAGSGTYGDVVAYSTNNKKSLSGINP
jgi:hypothetical protein